MNQNNSLDNLLQQGHLLLERDQYEAGLEIFQQADSLFSNNPQIKYGLGLAYFRLENYQKCIDYLNIAMRLQPVYSLALVRRGITYQALKQSDQANADLEAVLEIEPQTHEDWRARGIALSALSQNQVALICHERALEINPNCKVLRKEWAIIQSNLGNTYLDSMAENRKENIEQAITAYDAALRAITKVDFPQVWAMIQYNLGTAYGDRIIGNKKENIEQAITFLSTALRVRTEVDFPTDWAMIQNNLGNAYHNRILGDQKENIERAITAYHDVLRVRTEVDFPIDWAMIQYNLGNVYSDRITGDKKENIEQAITAYHNALRVRTEVDFPIDWAMTQYNLGNAYRHRIAGDKKENIERAITAYHDALRVRTEVDFPTDWATIQNNLGLAYHNRIVGDKKENIERAITAYHDALRVRTEVDFPTNWAMIQHNLGVAYCNRILGDKEENIEQAIASYNAALRVKTEVDFPTDWAMIQNNLGNTYHNRILGDKEENIEQAIASYNAALRVKTEVDFPTDWAMIQNNLGTAYSDRIVGDRGENIELAITALTQALRVYTEADFLQYWAATHNNLGNAYEDRIAGDRRNNLERAIIHYQNALTIYTPQNNPIECLRTARNLGNLALEQKRWQLAINAYAQAIEAVEISREAAGSEARKQEILSNAISVYVNMARACIQDGQYTKGIEYLERSKTRNLVDLLANSQMYPRGVSQQIIDSLDALRRNIIAAERRLQQQKTEECFNRLSSLRQSMEYLISKHIQPKDPGFQLSQRVEPISFAQIQAALPTPQTALIEWCVSKDTMAVFIVTKHQTQPLVITKDFEEVQTLEKIKEQYLSKYRERKDKWQERLILFLYQLAQTLDWDKIIKTLKQALPDCNKVILVPHRWLHIIPIHALPLKDGSCLLDRFPQGVSYAPSVQLFELTQKLSHPNLQNFFAVQNPTQDLRFTDIEVESIGSQFQPHDDIIKHQEAHRLALTKERLSKANCTHFSCHGEFNFEKPERSALLLAGSKVEQQDSGAEDRAEARFMPSRDGIIIDLEKCLTLGEIFTLDLRNCRLVTLSACETGLTDINNLSDEYIGLPSGFLYAGSPSVVSSLWFVSDLSTTFLMIKFYQNLQEMGSVPIALNQAQLWLRNVTKEELTKWKSTANISDEQMWKIDGKLLEMQDNSRPYASPYHWAAFCAVGS